MRHDPPDAALRLMASCPVRTHSRREVLHVKGSHSTRALIVDGVKYRSRLAVKQHYRIGNVRLDNWIAEGKARYV